MEILPTLPRRFSKNRRCRAKSYHGPSARAIPTRAYRIPWYPIYTATYGQGMRLLAGPSGSYYQDYTDYGPAAVYVTD